MLEMQKLHEEILWEIENYIFSLLETDVSNKEVDNLIDIVIENSNFEDVDEIKENLTDKFDYVRYANDFIKDIAEEKITLGSLGLCQSDFL